MGIYNGSASRDSECHEALVKLKSLYLPCLTEKTFLHISCREGLYCGFARFAGAKRVTGIDQDDECIRKATLSFPLCDFRQGSLKQSIDERFDVIILSVPGDGSCDICSLVKESLDYLSPKGILILEASVNQSESSLQKTQGNATIRSNWPSLGQFHAIFKACDAAWKTFGPRPKLKEEDMPTYIFHVSKRIPYAFLLMAPPASGKSYIASTVLNSHSLKTVKGDEVIIKITQGHYAIRRSLRRAISKRHQKFQGIQSVTEYILESGMARVLVDTWLQEAAVNANTDTQDILVDSYVPRNYYSRIARLLRTKGYIPVILKWKSPIDRQRGGKEFRQEVSRFLDSLAKTQSN
jgi:hypothetical protein